MRLNEDTYKYIRKASSQLEGITCALGICIENTIDIVDGYHYRVYNEFLNEVRRRHIETIKHIKEMFQEPKESVAKMLELINVSEDAKQMLNAEMEKFDEAIQRNIIAAENIRKCTSDTENPIIPESNDEFYQCFSKYNQLLASYPLEHPDAEDMAAPVIYSFCQEVRTIYSELFHEYDKQLEEINIESQTRGRNIENIRWEQKIFKKEQTKKNIAKIMKTGAIESAKKLAAGKKEEAACVWISTLAKISEELGKDESRKSRVRNGLKHLEVLDKAISLDEKVGMKKSIGKGIITAGAFLLLNQEKNIERRKSKMEILAGTAELTSKTLEGMGYLVLYHSFKIPAQTAAKVTANIFQMFLPAAAGAASGAAAVIVTGAFVVPKAVKIADSAMNLIESIAKYYGDNPKTRKLPASIEKKLFNLEEVIKKYKDDKAMYDAEMEVYKEKVKRKIPVKKPDEPPMPGWIKVHNSITDLKKKIETIEEIFKEKKAVSVGGGRGAW